VAEVAAGRALALHHPVRGLLLMAHAFATDDGIAFAEPGWDHLLAAGPRRLHAVAGRVRRSGAGWTVEMAEGGQAAIVRWTTPSCGGSSSKTGRRATGSCACC
jgi:hypothetical protein